MTITHWAPDLRYDSQTGCGQEVWIVYTDTADGVSTDPRVTTCVECDRYLCDADQHANEQSYGG